MSKPTLMLFSHVCGSSFLTGAEKYVLTLAIEASEHFDCTLVVPQRGILLTEAAQRGIRTLIHDIPLVWSMHDPEADLSTQMERKIKNHEHGGVINLLHAHQPDIVLVNSCVNPMPAIAAKTLGIPVVWCIAEKIAQHTHTLLSLELINRYSDWIIGMSDASLRPFRKAGLDKKLRLVPPTWHMEHLEPEAWPIYRESMRSDMHIEEGSRVIGYISSSLRPEKGIDHFVQMALSICDTVADAHFLIVGNSTDSYYSTHCQRLIDQSGHAYRFHRAHFQSRIERVYAAMDLVVIPSLVDEGFGMTALEGLVFGKGVIAYRSGGLEEILRSTGNAAWLVEKGDTAQLIAKVKEWLQDDNHRIKAFNNHLPAAEAVFGLETHRSRLQRLLTQMKEKISAAAEDNKSRMLPPLLMNAVYKGKATSTVFLLENGMKRPFASKRAFSFYKYRWSDVNLVSDAVLHRFPTGKSISTELPFHEHRPSIMMVKGRGPTVYLLVGEQRCPFSSMAAMRQRGLDPDRIVRVPDAELRMLDIGEPLRQLHKDIHPKRPIKKKRKLLRGRLGSRCVAARRRRKCRCVPKCKRRRSTVCRKRPTSRKGKVRKMHRKGKRTGGIRGKRVSRRSRGTGKRRKVA
ncbi:glycosyltransferase family 4 protein [Paenibacillus radicis (ex Xue et al. 2023)]|uniref:Glycosyltransferase n=1 Tax=Paenibacillus radicis (ex Xue et al. 2023) TaxID=2972489 RepID=A0ABT1Y935_9BACL|nr:glycosyltransferase [Paenibacillus radicis (ex Xue et al. 2023)]MCR8629692.1 glycosyltransferase [Paenibacillus radicis (ex Xue et al. 2023)]